MKKKAFKQFCADTVGYVEYAQGAIEKLASENQKDKLKMSKYNEKIASILKNFEKREILNSTEREALESEFKDNPIKLAEFFGNSWSSDVGNIGKSTNLKKNTDPILEFCFPSEF